MLYALITEIFHQTIQLIIKDAFKLEMELIMQSNEVHICRNLTRKAIFLSLFIAENCFKRDKTAESRGLSGAILSSTIQGWPVTKKMKTRIFEVKTF